MICHRLMPMIPPDDLSERLSGAGYRVWKPG